MPSGFSILGDTLVPPTGFSYTGLSVPVTAPSWSAEPALPAARSLHQAVTVAGRIHVLGGRDAGNVVTSAHDVFDPGTGMWSSGAAVPVAADFAAAELDGLLYRVGGGGGELAVYDPQADAWDALAPMAAGRNLLAAAAVDGRLYALGGRPGGAIFPVTTVDSYDPVTNTWSAEPAMSTARGVFQVVTLNGKLYALGGNDGVQPVATVEVFDPSLGTWSAGVSMPAPRERFAAAVFDGRIYVIGGDTTGGTPLATVVVFDPASGVWSSSAALPATRVSTAAAALGDGVIVTGGTNGGVAQSSVLSLDSGRLFVHVKD